MYAAYYRVVDVNHSWIPIGLYDLAELARRACVKRGTMMESITITKKSFKWRDSDKGKAHRAFIAINAHSAFEFVVQMVPTVAKD